MSVCVCLCILNVCVCVCVCVRVGGGVVGVVGGGGGGEAGGTLALLVAGSEAGEAEWGPAADGDEQTCWDRAVDLEGHGEGGELGGGRLERSDLGAREDATSADRCCLAVEACDLPVVLQARPHEIVSHPGRHPVDLDVRQLLPPGDGRRCLPDLDLAKGRSLRRRLRRLEGEIEEPHVAPLPGRPQRRHVHPLVLERREDLLVGDRGPAGASEGDPDRALVVVRDVG